MMNRKQKSKFNILRRNRGFAILCALGVLSVVLIVVMLFASRAKVASNISAIHLENQAARTLAKSLVPRIMLTINKSPEVQDQILYSSVYDHGNTELNKNYSSDNLYSYDWLWKLEHPAHIKFTPTERESDGTVKEMGTFVFYSNEDKTHGPKFDETKPYVPTWQYILDAPHPNDEEKVDSTLPQGKRNAIARFAFIIIPRIAHLDPNAIANHTLCQKLSLGSANVAGISHDTCRKCARKLGNSPAELMFGPPPDAPAELKNYGEGYFIESPLANAFVENQKIKWATIQEFCVDFGITPPGLDAGDQEVDQYINDKNTVTRFMEIDNAGDREAYWSDDGDPDEKDPDDSNKQLGENDGVRDPREFYHRFNMRRTDWENLTVSDIKKDPVEWSDLGQKEPSITGSGDRNNHNTGGIPWLANWKDKGDWGNADDTRDQVIANLLNFCSPPTRKVVSDVDPENWKSNEPKYTGLKRTLYINEYFYDVNFTATAEVNYDSNEDKTYVDATYKFNSEFMVELVDMYLNTLGDNKNNPVEFKSTMKASDFSKYKPEVYGTLSFEYMNPDSGAWESKSYTIDGDLGGLDFKRFEDTESTKIETIAERDKKYGYYGYFTDKSEEFNFGYEKPGNVSKDDVFNNMKVRKVKMNVEKIILYRTPTDDEMNYINGSSDDPKYKTFPKGLTGNKEYVDCSYPAHTYNSMIATFKVGSSDGTTMFAVLGNGEATDPRQNLRKKDWEGNLTVKTAKTETEYNQTKNTLSTMPVVDYSAGGIPIYTHGKNDSLSKSNPRVKKSNNNTHDCEATDDPSWKLSSGVKVEPTSFDSHISTAFIRHAVLRRVDNKKDGDSQYPLVEHPMESLWELGAIHRGSKWQTLNLSKSPEYTSAKEFIKKGAGDYEDGDGPILDQVKMTNDCLTFGKVNLLRHVDSEIRNTVIGALFRDMPVHRYGFYTSQGLNNSGIEDNTLFPNKSYRDAQVRIHDKNDPKSGKSETSVDADTIGKWRHLSYVAALYDVLYGDAGNENYLSKEKKLWRRTDFLAAPKSKGGAQDDEVTSDILYPIRQQADGYITDAMEEQIIGRTVNLMKIDSAVKGATAILVVQTLKDSGNNVTVFRDWNSDGKISAANKASDAEKESMIGQLQSGYRRFTDLDDDDKPFYQPPDHNTEKVMTGPRGKGTYQNGADTITGETKVIVTLDFDTATQKWKMVKYEYAE